MGEGWRRIVSARLLGAYLDFRGFPGSLIVLFRIWGKDAHRTGMRVVICRCDCWTVEPGLTEHQVVWDLVLRSERFCPLGGEEAVEVVPANAHFVLLGWFAFGVAADGFGRFTRCVFCSDFHGQFVMTLLFRRSYGWHIQLGQDDFFVLRLYRRFPTTEIRWRQLRFVLLLTLFEPFHSLLTS